MLEQTARKDSGSQCSLVLLPLRLLLLVLPVHLLVILDLVVQLLTQALQLPHPLQTDNQHTAFCCNQRPGPLRDAWNERDGRKTKAGVKEFEADQRSGLKCLTLQTHWRYSKSRR